MHVPHILSFGEVLWDLFPDGPRFGGAPANFACHAALLGARVSMLSAVGNDDRGSQALSILSRFGIDTSLVQTISGVATGAVGISLDPAGKPTFEIFANAAWDHIGWQDTLPQKLANVKAVYFGSLSQRSPCSRDTLQQVLREAGALGIPRVLDINLRPPFCDDALLRDCVANATLLKLSDEELPVLAAACAVPLSRSATNTLHNLRSHLGLEAVVMTRGEDGALMVTADGTFEQPGIPTAVVDTVGAGDAFTAAFVLGHLQRQPPDAILRRACEIASATCSHAGAVQAPIKVEPGHHAEQ